MRNAYSEIIGKRFSTALEKQDKPDLKAAVMDFLLKNPTPDDDTWHAWAEGKGFDVHEAEAIAYALAGRFVKLLRGGRSKGVRPKGASDEEIKAGIEVESEHTDDPDVQEKIAFDHAAEFKDYYSRLKKMETEAKAKEEK